MFDSTRSVSAITDSTIMLKYLPERLVLAECGGWRRTAGVIDEHIDIAESGFDRKDVFLDQREVRDVPSETKALNPAAVTSP